MDGILGFSKVRRVFQGCFLLRLNKDGVWWGRGVMKFWCFLKGVEFQGCFSLAKCCYYLNTLTFFERFEHMHIKILKYDA